MRRLRKLVELIGGFHFRGGAMQRAQRRMEQLLAANEEQIPAAEIDAYMAQARRYFTAFEREGRQHLKDVEERLAHVSQIQYNLTAERGVAVRRVEITQGVLAGIEELHSS